MRKQALFSETPDLFQAAATPAASPALPVRSPTPTIARRSAGPPELHPPTRRSHDRAASCRSTIRSNHETTASPGSFARCKRRTPVHRPADPARNQSWPVGKASQIRPAGQSLLPAGTLALSGSGSASLQLPDQLRRPRWRTPRRQPHAQPRAHRYLRRPRPAHRRYRLGYRQ